MSAKRALHNNLDQDEALVPGDGSGRRIDKLLDPWHGHSVKTRSAHGPTFRAVGWMLYWCSCLPVDIAAAMRGHGANSIIK